MEGQYRMPISYAHNIKRLLEKNSLGRKMASPGFYFQFQVPTNNLGRSSNS